MRLIEFASAEDQLALWRLVSDSVWSAIATQAEQERRDKAAKAARSNSQRGKRKSSPRAAKPLVAKAPASPKPAVDGNDKGKPQPTGSVKPQTKYPAPAQAPQPLGATGMQPRAPIQPIPPVASSAATPQIPQPIAKQSKPRITARAGGLTA
jgi:hypothetical protein